MRICLSGLDNYSKKEVVESLKLYDKKYKLFESVGCSQINWFLYDKNDLFSIFSSMANLLSNSAFVSNYGLIDAFFYSKNIDKNLHSYIEKLLDSKIKDYDKVYYFNSTYDKVDGLNISDKEVLDNKVWMLYNENPNKIVFFSREDKQEKLEKIIKDLLNMF